MKKKLLALLLASVFALSTSVVMFATSDINDDDIYALEYIDFYDLEIIDVFDEYTGLNLEILEDPELLTEFLYTREIMRLQQPALEAYNLLMGEFLSSNRSGEIAFAFRDDYAGAFIDDNHNLVIQLTNMDWDTVALYQSLVEYSDAVSFSEVAFSINELNEFGGVFVDALDEGNLQITSHGIDVITNSFSISLYYADEESVAFMNSFDVMSRMLPIPISFSLSAQIESLMLEGGVGIGDRTHIHDFSVGATGTGPVGNVLVTTGHIPGIRVGMNIFRNGNLIGRVHSFRGPTGGAAGASGDWAIITLDSFGTGLMTNRIRTGERLVPGQQNFLLRPPGTLVGGTGMLTIHWSGRIARTLQTFNNTSGITFVTPIARAPIAGDSGGTIYIPGSVTGQVILDGVLAGRLENGAGTVLYWTYTPAIWFAHFLTSIQQR